MIVLAAMFAGLASFLCFAHYTAVAWPSVAYRPAVARPLRLDRPDSFGHCMMVTLLALSTGVSLLIYQLRRYRNDDFKGHYRLWRIVMIVMALASINAMVGVIDWAGALLDAMFGKRVALTGSDWVRLVVSLAGTVLAIRLIAEVRRCRSALVMMIAACLLLALPEAAKWNVLNVDSLGRWVAVTTAPLLASTALFLALVVYLRMLYREVRQIEDSESLLQRIQQLRSQWWIRGGKDRTDGEKESSQEVTTARQGKAERNEQETKSRSWWRRRSKPKRTVERNATDGKVPQKVPEIEPEEIKPSSSNATQPRGTRVEAEKRESSKPRRRWFGLRSSKPRTEQPKQQSGKGDDDRRSDRNQEEGKTAPEQPRKRSRFSLRLKPQTAPTANQSSSDSSQQDDSEASTKSTKKRSSGRGWFRRGADKESQQPDRSPPSSNAATQQSRAGNETDAEAEIDPENIDWNALSKSERRRLRKQLKRQNRAA